MDRAMLPGMQDTLPLFSGIPMQIARKPGEPAATASASNGSPGQPRPVASGTGQSFATCGLCKDTGRLKEADRLHYCWCEAGDRARAEDQEAGRSIHEVTVSTVRGNFADIVYTRDNWVPEDDEWGSWEKSLKLRRDYMVGSRVPMGR